MTDRLVFYCTECAKEYPVGPRQKESRVYDLALRHVANLHHKIGPAAHRTIDTRVQPERA